MTTEQREFYVPEDLLWALADNAQAQAAFDKLPYSHRKEYVDWIESAKKSGDTHPANSASGRDDRHREETSVAKR